MGRRGMRQAIGLAAILLGVAASAGFSVSTRPLDVYFVDVEGGAATLIVTPRAESVLIDCGWPRADGRDARRIEHAARYVAGLSQIDHYVTTHWHTDHYGGIESLAALMPIRNFWDKGIPPSLQEDPRGFPVLMAAYQRASNGRSRTLAPGDRLPLEAPGLPLHVRVIAGNGKVIGEGKKALPHSCKRHSAKPEDTSDNAKSLAFHLKYGRFDFLNCGDLTWNIEHKLVCPTNRIGKIDLLQVTHHGADSSSNPALIHEVEPRCAVICNGPRKGGAASTFATLKNTPSLEGIFQLHRNVATRPEDNAPPGHIANLDENCAGQFIRVRLAEDASSYSVAIGAGPAVQSFRVR